MTVQQIKNEANRKRKDGDFLGAMELYKRLWDLDRNEWNGYFLAQCLRKIEEYSDARELHEQLARLYPGFTPIRNDKLWLDYNEKIKDWENPRFISDAEDILRRADRYDKYTSSVFTKTVLKTVKWLRSKREYTSASHWLSKLDQSVIDNSVFVYQGQVYPADRKEYFILLADVLVSLNRHIGYIEEVLDKLNFAMNKKAAFLDVIRQSITFDEGYISRKKLARYLKDFAEEFHSRLRQSPKIQQYKKKVTLVSDLSHYLFCPVSFAISETFKLDTDSSWERDEWKQDKKLFVHRHKIYKKTGSLKSAFDDSLLRVDQQFVNDLGYLFNSTIRVNNTTNPNPTIYENNSKSLKGAPDYLLQDDKGIKFVLTEKFSNVHSADRQKPFDSDLVKHWAFVEEIENIGASFGFFLTWYWDWVDDSTSVGNARKHMVITKYRIVKIEKNTANRNRLLRAIERVEHFRNSQVMSVDGQKLSWPRKCLNCSVMSYCNHKTGNYDELRLPYSLSQNMVSSEPVIEQ